MKFLAEWINVEKDGLPEPDENKTYFVLYDSGSGFGSYDYEFEISLTNGSDGHQHLKSTKLDSKRWHLDFDGVGHEYTITDYFEIIYPWHCGKENQD